MNGKTKFYESCDKLSVWALSLFVLECAVGSSGRWLSFGGISIRMVLFAVCFLLTLPAVFSQLRSVCRIPGVICTVLFGVYLVIAAVIGWRMGNSINFITADISSFLTLALLPGFLVTVCTKERVRKMMDMVFYGALVLGIVTTVLHFFFAFAQNWHINGINRWLNDHSMGGLAGMSTGVSRIYMKSQMFLQVGLLIGMWKLWTKSGRERWLLLAAEAVIAFACLMSYTRGFWLGFVFSAVLLLILEPIHWKRYLSTLGIVALLLGVLFSLSWLTYGKPAAAQEVVGRFNPDLISGAIAPPDSFATDPSGTEMTDPDDPDANEAAVLLRQKSLQMLSQRIRQHPIFGNGLGANLDGLRDDGKVEYMYFDIFMKTGLVGFLLFCAVFFLPVIQLIWQRIRRLKQGQNVSWDSPEMGSTMLLTAYMGILITSYVNPFLINPMGICLLLLVAAAARCMKS